MIPEKMPIIATVKKATTVYDDVIDHSYDNLWLSYRHPSGQIYTYPFISGPKMYRQGKLVHADVIPSDDPTVPRCIDAVSHLTFWERIRHFVASFNQKTTQL